MTLVIAGYSFQNSIKRTDSGQFSEGPFNSKPSGIFIAADSAITDSSGKTLLNGFRKVYAIPVKLWEPYFSREYFRGYKVEYQSLEVILAFAGNTLTAQHYINVITEHLGKLRITCTLENGPIAYRVALNCEKNPLHDPNMAWDEETFTSSDFHGLLTAKVIADAVRHSLEHAMRSARKYKLDEQAFRSLETPFILGVHCPVAQTYQIYEYGMSRLQMEGVFTIQVEQRELPHDKVAVIGMKGEFGDVAQQTFKNALENENNPATAIFDFLVESISKVNQRGEKGIALPAVIKSLENGVVKFLRKSKDSL